MDNEMIKCPACGSINSRKREKCVYCHADLNENVVLVNENRHIRSDLYTTPLNDTVRQPVIINNYMSTGPQQSNSALLLKKLKSQMTQFILVVLFGPLGVLYSSIIGFLAVFVLDVLAFLLVVVFCTEVEKMPDFLEYLQQLELDIEYFEECMNTLWIIFCYLTSFIVGALAVHSHNKNVYLGMGYIYN